MTSPATLPACSGDALLLTQAIQAIADNEACPVPLDVVIHRALGWRVEPQRLRPGRPPAWRAKSPLSSEWIALPRPTRDLAAARRLVPWGWSWGVGQRNGIPQAWVADRHPVVEGTTWFEGTALSPELALTKVALFGHRALAMRAEALAA